MLANLLRINQIPLAYIPPEPYQRLRDLVRCRTRMGRELAEAKIQLRALLAQAESGGPLSRAVRRSRPGVVSQSRLRADRKSARDELLARLTHFGRQIAIFDRQLVEMAARLSADGSLLDIHGIGLFSALLIVAELGEVERFRTAKQVGAYAGLTSPVHQSGGHCYQGSITRQGSPWLRWILVEAAMKTIREDAALKNFYTRVRKRSSAKIARVAAARKLAEICWKRLAALATRTCRESGVETTMLIRAPARPLLARKGTGGTKFRTVRLIGHFGR